MHTLRFLLRKEFLQIFRNRGILPLLFVMPFVQLVLLANAATFEVKSAAVSVVDADRSPASRRLVEALMASGHFELAAWHDRADAAEADLQAGRARMLLHVPRGFERDLRRGQSVPVQLVFDAVNGSAAGVLSAYARTILSDYNRRVVVEMAQTRTVPPSIQPVPRFWFNPALSYKAYMVPGILVNLITLTTLLLSALNIVREKEAGTLEQLNVTPVTKTQFIAGKLVPFWVIGMVELALGLVVANVFFDVPMRGSMPLVFGLAAVYLLGVLGLGLWISAINETQQQATFVTVFIAMIFILLSGLFTPISSMPDWVQPLTLANPIAHYITVMRVVMLKGAGLVEVMWEVVWLTVFAVAALGLAVQFYRKTSA